MPLAVPQDPLLAAVVAASPMAIIAVDLDTTVRLWNPAAERLFGWAAAEVIGRPIPIVPPDRTDECESIRAQLHEGQVPGTLETWRVARDGTRIPVAISVAPISGPTAMHRVLVFEDLRERQPADEARTRLAAIVESSDDAIVSKDLNGTIQTWNRGAERLFGYSAEEVVGKSITILIPLDRRQEEEMILSRIGRGESIEHYETVRQRKDGSLLDISLTVSPIYDRSGNVVGASKIARDITAQKRTEREISTLYMVGQTVAAELNRERVLQTITDAATELSGAQFGAFFYNATDPQGDHFLLYTLSGADRASFENFGSPRNTAIFAPTFAGEGVVRLADVRQDPRYGLNAPYFGVPPGHLPVVSYLAVPVISRNGEVFGGLFLGHPRVGAFSEEAERIVLAIAAQAAIALDNAQLYEAEQRARNSAELANRMKDEFLAMLSHELRNPLSAVRNSVAVALLDPAQREHALEIARHGTDQLTRLTDDLLDVTRITQGRIKMRKTKLSLDALVTQSFELAKPLFAERGIALTMSLSPQAIGIDGDPVRLEQAITNLLTNAAKYTEPGGSAWVSLALEGERAVLRVKDNGVGIEPQLLARIFDLFVQGDCALDRSRGGLGIGLTLAKQLIEMHGGQITAYSEGVGRGSEFVVHLPAYPAEPVAEQVEAAPRAAHQAPRVLIVEDNEDAAESLKMLLELLGVRVRAVGDGPSALESARSHPPDVMLIDIGLPGMSGYELAERLRQQDALRQVTLVALTGYGQEEDRQRAFAAGFDRHMVKPLDPALLEKFIADLRPA